MNDTRPGPSVEVRTLAVEGGTGTRRYDRVATEEPLEIRVRANGETRSLAITMRTPGHDFELAAGFLHGEGILDAFDRLGGMTYCLDGSVDEDQQYNIVNVDLRGELPAFDRLERHFTTTSACGICGRASLEALEFRGLASLANDAARIDASTLNALPERLRAAQRTFALTGGLHAAGIFGTDGTLVVAREDVGRHNAVDKVLGHAFLARRALAGHVLVVSGRTSYEIVQKALAAGVPIVCAVSAPSSLAVELARRFGLTLAGFVRGERFNLYAGEERVLAPDSRAPF